MIANGSGVETTTDGGQNRECTVVDCDVNFTNVDNECVANT